jgi:hypothetical protein
MIPETWRNKQAVVAGLVAIVFIGILFLWQFGIVGGFQSRHAGLSPAGGSFGRHLFEQEIRVSGQGSYIEVPHHLSLVPSKSSSKDFLIAVWFRLGDISVGRRSILLVKYDRKYPPHPGYAIAFRKAEDNSIRPEVYWQDKEGKGGWLVFPDITESGLNIQEAGKEWQLILLSFRKGRYLGLHHGVYRQNNFNVDIDTSGIRTLGGYDLPNIDIPDSNSALFLGTPYIGDIRANIGFFGIAQLPHLTEQLTQIANSLFAVPMTELSGELATPSSVVKSEDWSLFIGGGGGGGGLADYSANNHKVIARRVRVSEPLKDESSNLKILRTSSEAVKGPNRSHQRTSLSASKGHN